jgi:hypothetical protein
MIEIENIQNEACTCTMWKVHLDNLPRLPGEEGNPRHSPDVSSTRLRGELDTTLQVASKQFKFGKIQFLLS